MEGATSQYFNGDTACGFPQYDVVDANTKEVSAMSLVVPTYPPQATVYTEDEAFNGKNDLMVKSYMQGYSTVFAYSPWVVNAYLIIPADVISLKYY